MAQSLSHIFSLIESTEEKGAHAIGNNADSTWHIPYHCGIYGVKV